MDTLLVRIIIVVFGVVVFGLYVINRTGDLDNVKNSSLYRIAYFMMLMHGWVGVWTLILFPMFNGQ